MALEIKDMDKTVDPELYSTTVFVFPGTTQLFKRFNAVPLSDNPKLYKMVLIPGIALTLFAGCIVIILA